MSAQIKVGESNLFDFKFIAAHSRESDADLLMTTPEPLKAYEYVCGLGPNCIMYADNVPFAAGGVAIFPAAPWMAETWAVTTPLVESFPKAYTRVCKNMIAKAFRDFPGLERIQGRVHPSHTQSLRWHERCLGYKREGVLRGVRSNGGDLVMFSVLRGDKYGS